MEEYPQPVNVRQMTLSRILLMHLWPAIAFFVVIYGIGPKFAGDDRPVSFWFVLFVMVVCNGLELAAGVAGLRRSGRPVPLRRSPRRRGRWYVSAIAVLIVGFAAAAAVTPVHRLLAESTLLAPPSWWPAATDPTVPKSGIADAFPDVNLSGNWLFFFAYVTIGLFFNVIGEEVYYRAYLLPRMHGVFGRWAWVASSLLFTAKHIYQPWALPGVLVGALCFGFAAGPLKSVRLAILYHWIGNYLLPVGMLFLAVMNISM